MHRSQVATAWLCCPARCRKQWFWPNLNRDPRNLTKIRWWHPVWFLWWSSAPENDPFLFWWGFIWYQYWVGIYSICRILWWVFDSVAELCFHQRWDLWSLSFWLWDWRWLQLLFCRGYVISSGTFLSSFRCDPKSILIFWAKSMRVLAARSIDFCYHSDW